MDERCEGCVRLQALLDESETIRKAQEWRIEKLGAENTELKHKLQQAVALARKFRQKAVDYSQKYVQEKRKRFPTP